MKDKIRDKAASYKDERVIARLSTAAIVAYIWIPIAVALFITPLHEILHFAGAMIEGAVISEVQVLIVDNWIQQYFFLQPNGPIGQVVAQFPSNASGIGPFPATSIYYFLPYTVMFPLSLFLIAGDNVGISNIWRIIGAPMLWASFIAFWNDLALYQGAQTASIPLPPFLLQALYISVIMVGITGTTWLSILQRLE